MIKLPDDCRKAFMFEYCPCYFLPDLLILQTLVSPVKDRPISEVGSYQAEKIDFDISL